MATIGPGFQLPTIQFKPLPPPVFKGPQPANDEPAEKVSIGQSPTVPLPTVPLPTVPMPAAEPPTVPLRPPASPTVAEKTVPMQIGDLLVQGNQNKGSLFMEAAPAPDIALDWAPNRPLGKSGQALGIMGAAQAAGGGIAGVLGRALQSVGFGKKKSTGPTSASPERIKEATSTPFAIALREAAAGLASTPKEQAAGHFQMLESALLDPNVTVLEKKHLGGGINGTFLVTLSNGARGVFKPTLDEDQSKLRNQLEKDHQGKREEAAYLVDKAMGHVGRIPPTVRRSIDGKEGALMLFVPDAEVAMGSGKVHNTMAKDDSYRRLAILDNVIGNLDRHEGNWMVTKDGDALPIDHGLAFPWKNESQGFVNYDFQMPVTLSTDDLQSLQNLSSKREALTQRLSGLLEKPAIDSMFDRVDRMLQEKTTSTWWHGSDSRIGWDR